MVAEFVVRGLPVLAIEAAVEHLAAAGAFLCFATAAQIERHWVFAPLDRLNFSLPVPASPTDALLVRAPHLEMASRICAWLLERHGGILSCSAPLEVVDDPLICSASLSTQSDAAGMSEVQSHVECGCLDRANGTCLCLQDFGSATDESSESATCCSLAIRACCCFIRAAPISTLRRRSLLFPIFLDAVSDAYSSSFLAFLLLVRLMLQYNVSIFFAGGGEGFNQFSHDYGCKDASVMNFFVFDVCGEFLAAGIDVHLGQLAAFLSTFVLMAGNTKWNSVVWLWLSAALSLCKSIVYIVLLVSVKDGYAYPDRAGGVTLSRSPLKVLAAMVPLQMLISIFFIALLLEEYRLISKSWRHFMKSIPKVAFFWLRSCILKSGEMCGRTRQRRSETLGEVRWTRDAGLPVDALNQTSEISLGTMSSDASEGHRVAESINDLEEHNRDEDSVDSVSMQSVSSFNSDISSIPSARIENHLAEALLSPSGA